MEVIITSLIIGFASLFQGITGFGYAVIAAPMLLLFLPQNKMIVMFSIIGLSINSYLFYKIKIKSDLRLLKPLLYWGIAGLPIGMFILKFVNTSLLKISTAVFCISLIVLPFIFKRFKSNGTLEGISAIGLTGGILQTSIGTNGPLFGTAFRFWKITPAVTRKTLALLFSIFNLVSLCLLLSAGFTNIKELISGIIYIPPAVIGSELGHRLFGKINKESFELLTYFLVILSAILLILQALSVNF